jgi:hypothetical protein
VRGKKIFVFFLSHLVSDQPHGPNDFFFVWADQSGTGKKFYFPSFGKMSTNLGELRHGVKISGADIKMSENDEVKQSLLVSVVTYNLLSPLLARPDYHVGSDARHLDFGHRLAVASAYLSDLMLRYAPIICLQEFSDEWRDALIPLFDASMYRIVSQSYGKFPKHWGGVAIAVPVQFRIVGVKSLLVADEIGRLASTSSPSFSTSSSSSSSSASSASSSSSSSSVPEKKKTVLSSSISSSNATSVTYTGTNETKRPGPSSVGARVRTLNKTAVSVMQQTIGLAASLCSTSGAQKWDKWARGPSPIESAVERATKKENYMIVVHVEHRATKVECVVGTYHCPCAFYDPEVMALHLGVASRVTQTFVPGLPCVFAGDFNVKPDDAAYKLLTDGFPNLFVGVTVPGLRSAYRTYVGSEPNHTCHSIIYKETAENKRQQFTDCLDYILCSADWHVKSVIPLPAKPTAHSYPSEHEPSDHCPVFVTLTC